MFWKKAENTYHSFTDEQLVQAICSGDEDAAVYLIFKRYYMDIRYLCFDCYGSHEYVNELCHELYILLKGKNGDWQPLSTWTGLSTLRTWLNRVTKHMILKNRDALIGIQEKKLYSDSEDELDPVELIPADTPSVEENFNKVLLLEVIGKLKNEEHRLIFVKELQGYNHAEIAEMINLLRAKENRIRVDEHNHPIFVDAKTVDRIKQQAMGQLKKQFLALKETLY